MANSTEPIDGCKVMDLGVANFGGAEDDNASLECGTLPIDEDSFMGVGDAAANNDADNDGESDEERGAGGFAQMQTLTVEERVGLLENEVMVLRGDVENIKSRMADLIEVQNGMTAQPGNEGRKVVTAAEFEKMVDGALKSGTKYGVSRSYITRFISAEFGQENNKYLQKKLGLLLKKKLTTNEYLLNDALYRLNEK